MTNHETELEVQACLDRELSGGAVRTVEDLLSRDVEARALFEELRTTKSLVAENELEQKLPESREFFWSGIERRIKADEGLRRTAEVSEGRATSWLRFLAPAGALGALAIFVGMALWTPEKFSTAVAWDDSHEIETPLEETSSFSFRSEAAAMTVVWVDSHRE
ncbi:MAG TPA: hypothetical protein VN887_14325 [Candidatus Angelobacter sp.]|nr:hypothetical protein [Candidatus Angelobacter sp.]